MGMCWEECAEEGKLGFDDGEVSCSHFNAADNLWGKYLKKKKKIWAMY